MICVIMSNILNVSQTGKYTLYVIVICTLIVCQLCNHLISKNNIFAIINLGLSLKSLYNKFLSHMGSVGESQGIPRGFPGMCMHACTYGLD